MSFGEYSRHDFGTKLSEVVSPSRPIRSIQYLKGRESQLDTIDRALFAPGRHVFIYRQLETVELPRLGWEARREIVVRAAEAFGLSVDDNINWRIAAVSDGYPYYVHLITEKMLWEAFFDERAVDSLDPIHYQLGLRAAIQSISAELKKPYEQAVNFREQDYENVVWSTADGDDLLRSLKDMYEAYQVIALKREGGNELDRAKYSECVRKLKDKAYGEILEQVKGRKGWYIYREKMLRGFVRMQAEANGVQLAGERIAPRQKIHVPGNTRTGYYGPSIPRGVRDKK